MPSVIAIGNTRVLLPESLAGTYLDEAGRLWRIGRADEAEVVMREAVRWFPDNSELRFNYAKLAERRQDWPQVKARWHDVQVRYPERWPGFVGEALALCHLDRLDEAEALLSDAMDRFPDEPQPVLDHARVALLRRDWGEAVVRCASARSRFPGRSVTYIGEAWALRELGRFDEAEALLRQTIGTFPDEAQAVLDFARIAEARKGWPEAAQRWERARQQRPSDIAGFIGGAVALRELRRFDEAENVLREAIAALRPNVQVWSIYADLATRRNDWPEALRRWQEAEIQFPSEREIPHRIYEARLRVVEIGLPSEVFADRNASRLAAVKRASEPSPDVIVLGQLMMEFESLGGLPHGCEFGTMQRESGAEPLSLLRWSDIAPDQLAAALEAQFAGVGLPENTELFLADNAGRQEYRTKDTRFGMIMHTFIHGDSITYEKMHSQVCRRLQFLAQKLISDLEVASKIFVFKVNNRNLLTAEIDRIYGAMRRYGDNTLLYVRYQDAEHPNGTVEIAKPGLMIGYIDHFTFSCEGTSLGAPVQSWLALCTKASELARPA